MTEGANLDAESDRFHDKDPIREDSGNFLHAGEILDGIPNVPVFIQQLELSCREDINKTKKNKGGKGRLEDN